MTFGSLFSGIGGLDLGLERAGMECRWQVEIDDYARRVLAKHWPHVRRWDDARTFPPDPISEWVGVDLICGGFPCQDISYAGKGAGLNGERSGLWYEFARIVRALRPRYVLVENVSALLTRGLDAVLGTLASHGYDAEWACIPAAAIGAPHYRDRLFIMAYRKGIDGHQLAIYDGSKHQGIEAQTSQWTSDWSSVRVVDGYGNRRTRRIPDPGICRVAHGVPSGVDRIRGLGNAVVPQVAELIGRSILEYHRRTSS